MATQIIAPVCGAAQSNIRSSAKDYTKAEQNAARARINTQQQYREDVHIGAIEDLIAAGVMTLAQCPGQAGNPPKSATYYDGERRTRGMKAVPRDLHYFAISLYGRGRARVVLGLSEDEASRREEWLRADIAAMNAERQQKEQLAVQARYSRKALSEMVTTHAAYRADVVQTSKVLLNLVRDGAGRSKWHGFSYCDDAKAQLAELADEMIQILETGTTCFNAKLHATIATKWQADIARGDPKFVGMLAALQQPALIDQGEAVQHG
ncbi:hypothetical protein SRS16CHR_02588 [Variovorax sp. SRS16]|uniref:hypothetical protein n=1 Tax=Variovorax sp. SRS16 TaxID=282217 RepID=UPI0013193C0E|nr:hypothetical protein [Variovorax sp. SRS16]VTU20167.1 hypothetical protein SRS16CHR_02588 [Variovorax sp. SRS16]